MTDTPVDWTKPLVAVHPDGRRVDVELRFPRPDQDGNFIVRPPLGGCSIFHPNGEHFSGATDWRIENREQPPAYPEGMTPELVERMVELTRRMADTEQWTDTGWAIDARAIMAELEPVDPLLIEARKIAATECERMENKAGARQCLSGEWDNQSSVLIAYAAIQAGMELAEANQ